MKKGKFLTLFAIASMLAKLSIGQVYMASNGYVSIGTPSSGSSNALTPFQSFGNVMFCNVNSPGSFAPYINASNGTSPSSATSLDYSWYNDASTGIFHPQAGTISFSAGGSTVLNLQATSYGQVIYTTIPTTTSSTAWNIWSTSSSMWTFGVEGTGDAWGKSWWSWSDAKLKENIQTIPNALNRALKLRGVNYTFIADKVNNPGVTPDLQMGLIAQEVEQIVPEVVTTGPNGYKGIAYQNLVGLLIEALKEEDKKVQDLQTIVTNCCTLSQSGIQNQSTISTNENSSGTTVMSGQAALYQNAPNPFNQSTIIQCFIPDQSNTASLMVFDMTGALKNTIQIGGKDTQSISINAGQLAPGMYYYTLLVDGKEIDTKKMILTK